MVNGKSFTSVIVSGVEVTSQHVGMMAFDTFNTYLSLNFPSRSYVLIIILVILVLEGLRGLHWDVRMLLTSKSDCFKLLVFAGVILTDWYMFSSADMIC